LTFPAGLTRTTNTGGNWYQETGACAAFNIYSGPRTPNIIKQITVSSSSGMVYAIMLAVSAGCSTSTYGAYQAYTSRVPMSYFGVTNPNPAFDDLGSASQKWDYVVVPSSAMTTTVTLRVQYEVLGLSRGVWPFGSCYQQQQARSTYCLWTQVSTGQIERLSDFWCDGYVNPSTMTQSQPCIAADPDMTGIYNGTFTCSDPCQAQCLKSTQITKEQSISDGGQLEDTGGYIIQQLVKQIGSCACSNVSLEQAIYPQTTGSIFPSQPATTIVIR